MHGRHDALVHRARAVCLSARRTALCATALGLLLAGGCVPTLCWKQVDWLAPRRSLAIPDTYPLGAVNRAHYHAMETNGEAEDFIIYRREFVGQSAELTSEGKDHVLEIAARMPSVPFPVIIERTENNADPELDQHRKQIVAQILSDLGNPDAFQRTVVAPGYSRHINSQEGVIDYARFIFSRRFGGGIGGGGFGGGGFGGGAGAGGGFGGF